MKILSRNLKVEPNGKVNVSGTFRSLTGGTVGGKFRVYDEDGVIIHEDSIVQVSSIQSATYKYSRTFYLDATEGLFKLNFDFYSFKTDY